MTVSIIYPDYADDFFWFEHEAKGFVVLCVTDGKAIRELEFYDPGRLLQDVESETAADGYSCLSRVVVIPTITRAGVEEAVRRAGTRLLS